MDRSTTNRLRLTPLLAATLAVLSVLAPLTYVTYRRATARVVRISPSGINLSDHRRLVGFADNVFVGTVVEQQGYVDPGSSPIRTVFAVTIQDTLKGVLSGEVTVNMVGGEDVYGNHYVVEGLNMPDVGGTYLFASRTSADERVGETIAAPYGLVPIDSEEALTAVRRRFARAVTNQIPWPVPNPVTQAS